MSDTHPYLNPGQFDHSQNPGTSDTTRSLSHTQIKRRIASIDILRGFVMLLMLVDHVRHHYFFQHTLTDPMTLEDTTTGLFFTRLSSHLCAPVFVFLTGLSAWLYANPPNAAPRSPREFLLKRGVFIIFMEMTFVSFTWFGSFDVLGLQVMWAIGVSMLVLALCCRLPIKVIGLIGLVIVGSHNLLDGIQIAQGEPGFLIWTVLHQQKFIAVNESFSVFLMYPLVPWVGLILVGHACGPLFARTVDATKRQKTLFAMATGSVLLLLILRGFNLYGETQLWQTYDSTVLTIQSFINFTKYPPSLDYLLFTIGIACFILGALEFKDNRLTRIIEGFGAAPMFFYILHLYALLITHRITMAIFGSNITVFNKPHMGLQEVWQIWLIASVFAVVLYFPSKWFADYKRRSDIWWVKYF